MLEANSQITKYICVKYFSIILYGYSDIWLNYSDLPTGFLSWKTWHEACSTKGATIFFAEVCWSIQSSRVDIWGLWHISQQDTCYFCRETSMNRPFVMLLTFNFSDGCGCSSSSIEWPVDFLVRRFWQTFIFKFLLPAVGNMLEPPIELYFV
jgi:hypothetical protein